MKHQLQAMKPVIIMPIHLRSILLYHALSHNGVEVLGFWDNDETLNGESYDGVDISLPVSADKFGADVTVILCYNKYRNELKAQMESLGHYDIISAQMLSVYKIQERLDSYRHSVNANDFARIKSQYSSSGCLWIGLDKNINLSKMLPDEYSDAIENAIIRHYGGEFNEKRRKVLLLSCSMDYNGALVALKNAAIALLESDDIPIVFSKHSGDFLHELLKSGIPVLIDPSLPEDYNFLNLAISFDLVIVNSIFSSNTLAIRKLSSTAIPVIWWIHEPIYCYEIAEALPQDIGKNIHVYCVGEYACRAFYLANMGNTDVKAEVLLYGIKEDENTIQYSNVEKPHNHRVTIMTVGSIEERKGQDILCEAIRKLDASVRTQCEFVFIGRLLGQNNRVYSEMLTLKQDYPKLVTLIDQLDRDAIYEAISQCDCMICSSRDDPMPVFITEAMMYEKICICSENTGTAALIEHGKNGYIYNKNDPEQLRCLIEHIVSNFTDLQEIGKKGRRIFDEYFSFDVFKQNLINAVNDAFTSR